MEILFVIGRVLYGGFFLAYGLSTAKNSRKLSDHLKAKRIVYARTAAVSAGVILALVGAGLMLGAYPRVTLTVATVILAFMSFAAHDYWNRTEPREIANEMSNFIRNIALIGVTFMLYSLLEPWSYSL